MQNAKFSRWRLELSSDERVYAEAVYMSSNMTMEAKMKGSLLKAIGRKFAGETMFLTEFTPAGGESLFFICVNQC